MKLQLFQADAFAASLFKGNPAAIVPMNEWLSDETMQQIAAENNLSETAFFIPENDQYHIRWFTPKSEVALCGHATLATAHILYETGFLKSNEQIKFDTKSGVLTARITNDMIELDFPQMFVDNCESNEIIEKAFDIKPVYIGKNDKRYLIEIDSIERLKTIKPDFQLLQKSDRGGFMITAKSDDNYDFYSRFFAPGVGINEDQV